MASEKIAAIVEEVKGLTVLVLSCGALVPGSFIRREDFPHSAGAHALEEREP